MCFHVFVCLNSVIVLLFETRMALEGNSNSYYDVYQSTTVSCSDQLCIKNATGDKASKLLVKKRLHVNSNMSDYHINQIHTI